MISKTAGEIETTASEIFLLKTGLMSGQDFSYLSFAKKIMEKYAVGNQFPWTAESLIFLMQTEADRKNAEKQVFYLTWKVLRIYLEKRLEKCDKNESVSFFEKNLRRMVETNLRWLKERSVERYAEIKCIFEEGNRGSREEIEKALEKVEFLFSEKTFQREAAEAERTFLKEIHSRQVYPKEKETIPAIRVQRQSGDGGGVLQKSLLTQHIPYFPDLNPVGKEKKFDSFLNQNEKKNRMVFITIRLQTESLLSGKKQNQTQQYLSFHQSQRQPESLHLLWNRWIVHPEYPEGNQNLNIGVQMQRFGRIQGEKRSQKPSGSLEWLRNKNSFQNSPESFLLRQNLIPKPQIFSRQPENQRQKQISFDQQAGSPEFLSQSRNRLGIQQEAGLAMDPKGSDEIQGIEEFLEGHQRQGTEGGSEERQKEKPGVRPRQFRKILRQNRFPRERTEPLRWLQNKSTIHSFPESSQSSESQSPVEQLQQRVSQNLQENRRQETAPSIRGEILPLRENQNRSQRPEPLPLLIRGETLTTGQSRNQRQEALPLLTRREALTFWDYRKRMRTQSSSDRPKGLPQSSSDRSKSLPQSSSDGPKGLPELLLQSRNQLTIQEGAADATARNPLGGIRNIEESLEGYQRQGTEMGSNVWHWSRNPVGQFRNQIEIQKEAADITARNRLGGIQGIEAFLEGYQRQGTEGGSEEWQEEKAGFQPQQPEKLLRQNRFPGSEKEPLRWLRNKSTIRSFPESFPSGESRSPVEQLQQRVSQNLQENRRQETAPSIRGEVLPLRKNQNRSQRPEPLPQLIRGETLTTWKNRNQRQKPLLLPTWKEALTFWNSRNRMWTQSSSDRPKGFPQSSSDGPKDLQGSSSLSRNRLTIQQGAADATARNPLSGIRGMEESPGGYRSQGTGAGSRVWQEPEGKAWLQYLKRTQEKKWFSRWEEPLGWPQRGNKMGSPPNSFQWRQDRNPAGQIQQRVSQNPRKNRRRESVSPIRGEALPLQQSQKQKQEIMWPGRGKSLIFWNHRSRSQRQESIKPEWGGGLSSWNRRSRAEEQVSVHGREGLPEPLTLFRNQMETQQQAAVQITARNRWNSLQRMGALSERWQASESGSPLGHSNFNLNLNLNPNPKPNPKGIPGQNRGDRSGRSSEQGRNRFKQEMEGMGEPIALVYAEKNPKTAGKEHRETARDNKNFTVEEIQRLETKLRQQEFQSDQDKQLVEELTKKLDAQSRIVERLQKEQESFEKIRSMDRKSLSRKAIGQLKAELRMERLRSGME